MNLSDRAELYWNQQCSARSNAESAAVDEFFRLNGLPCAAPFVDCVALAGGLNIEVPSDTIHFFSLDDLRRSRDMVKADYFFGDGEGDWFYACDSFYPGNCCLHKSGSFHYERDPNEKWADSLAEIVEAASLLSSLGREAAKLRVSAGFGGTLSALERRINCSRDAHASSSSMVYYPYRGGLIFAFRFDVFDRRDGCGLGALLPSDAAVVSLQEDLKGLLTGVSIKDIG